MQTIHRCARHWLRFGGALVLVAVAATAIREWSDGHGSLAGNRAREPMSPIGAAAFGDDGAETRSGQAPVQSVADEQSNDAETAGQSPIRRREIEDRSPAFALGWPDRAEAELRFSQEGTDPEWSERTEGALLGVVGELDQLAVHSIEVDCRMSMCRLELYHPRDVDQIYSIRQIYARVSALGLGPMLAEKGFSDGGLPTLSIFLRRTAP